MKKITLTIIFGTLIYTSLFAQWVELGNANTGFVSTYNIVNIESTLFISAGNGGIYKSTNNGTIWTKKKTGLPLNEGIQDLVEHNGILYASIYRNGIYISLDEGETWSPINSGINTLTFYNIGINGSNIYGGYANGGIYFSSDNGEKWVEKSNNVSDQQIQDFAFFNSQVYASGKSLFKSSNNGDTWNEVYVNGQTPNGFRCMLATENKLYLGGDGNIFSSTDGINWTNHNLNLGSTITNIKSSLGKVYFTTGIGKIYCSENDGQNWKLLQNNDTNGQANDALIMSDKILMSTSEGLYTSIDNGLTWTATNNQVSPLNVISMAVYDDKIYAGTSYQGIFRYNSNSGWAKINSGLDGNNAYNVEDIIILEDKLFLGTGGGIYTSTDFGNTWYRLFDPGLNKSSQALNFDNNTFVSATNGTGVYISEDLGNTWTLLENIGLNTDTSYWSIQIKDNTIVTSTHDGEIFISENLGTSWSNISIPLGYSPAFDLILTDQKLYAGTNKGIYVSTDKGENWELLGKNTRATWSIIKIKDKIFSATSSGIFETNEINGTYKDISNPIGSQAIKKIITTDQKFYVGTFSSGVWERFISDVDENLSTNSSNNNIENFFIYPNPIKNELNIYINNFDNLSKINILSINGELVFSKNITKIGVENVDLSFLKSGLYFLQIILPNETKVRKLIKE